MDYDKVKADGTTIKAPAATRHILNAVPVLFQLAEWLLVIVAFQYVDSRFGYIAAKVAWIVLSIALALYAGILASNFLWRVVEDPYRKGGWNFFSLYVLPVFVALAIAASHQLVRRMVLAQQVGG